MEIGNDVQKFLNAISQINKDDFNFSVLSLFPKECCEYSSMMLARYLIEECGYAASKIKMITGQFRDDYQSKHLWLNVLGMTVDITCGQFKNSPKNIIIEQVSAWHDSFIILDSSKPIINFESYLDDYEEQALEYDYSMIIQNIHQNLTEF
ncbi:hypothetical protein [Acinetobacter sp. TGL-Y2]|uniref:hypothetical protein n=1 Tax=Acinetobacter sp. TGL-Y2 TaxID=1407071 RepID=UPI000B243076|nr:hypothetical protein [Acinetobacter sp. TGL-Y2]